MFVTGLARQPYLVDAGEQADGKVVSIGNSERLVGNQNDRDDMVLCRYNAAGNLDPTFGPGGLGCRLIDINGGADSQEYADGAAMDHFGRILVIGHTGGHQRFVARFTPEGNFDVEFNGGLGLRIIELPELQRFSLEAVNVDLDGRILIAGQGVLPNSEQSLALVMRLDDGGGFDPDFSGDGRALFTMSVANDPLPRDTILEDVAVDDDGRIALVGLAALPDLDHPDWRAAFVRLQPSGSFDPTFNGSGWRLDRGPQDEVSHAYQLRIDEFGRWVVGGSSRPIQNGSPTNAMVWRLTPNGSLDTRFDGDGRVYLDNAITYGSDTCADDFAGLVLEHDSILVTMTSQSDTMANDTDIITMRLSAADLFGNGFD